MHAAWRLVQEQYLPCMLLAALAAAAWQVCTRGVGRPRVAMSHVSHVAWVGHVSHVFGACRAAAGSLPVESAGGLAALRPPPPARSSDTPASLGL